MEWLMELGLHMRALAQDIGMGFVQEDAQTWVCKLPRDNSYEQPCYVRVRCWWTPTADSPTRRSTYRVSYTPLGSEQITETGFLLGEDALVWEVWEGFYQSRLGPPEWAGFDGRWPARLPMGYAGAPCYPPYPPKPGTWFYEMRFKRWRRGAIMSMRRLIGGNLGERGELAIVGGEDVRGALSLK